MMHFLRVFASSLLLLGLWAVPCRSQEQGTLEKEIQNEQKILPGTPEMSEVFDFFSHCQDPSLGPDFVAARRILLPSGKFDKTLLSDRDIEYLRTFLAMKAKNGCVEVDWISSVEDPGPMTLDKLVRERQHIVIGRVTGLSPGFEHGLPGTLLRIQSEEILKGGAIPGAVFAFYPQGEMWIDDAKLCRSNPQWGPMPDLAEHVLLAYNDVPWCQTAKIVRVGPEGIFALREGRPVELSLFYQNDGSAPAKSATPLEFLEIIKGKLEETEK